MKESGSADNTAYGRVMFCFMEDLPGLFKLCVDNQDDFHSIRVYGRGNEDILVVCKRYDSKGELVVNFGGGFDLGSALLSASHGCEDRDWRPDIPYDERKK